MADIFISYKREDKAIAKYIADKISEHGWSVWWDHDIPAGKDYDRVIEEELNKCRCTVVLWSEQSILSRNVKDEANIALVKGKLIPVVLGQVQPPIGFRMIQGIQWNNNTKPDTDEINSLIKNIDSTLGQPPIHGTKIIKQSTLLRKRYILIVAGVVLLIFLFIYFKNTDKTEDTRLDLVKQASDYVNKDTIVTSDENSFESNLLLVTNDASNQFRNYWDKKLGSKDYGNDLICRLYSSKINLSSSNKDSILFCKKFYYYKSLLEEGSDSAKLQTIFNGLAVKVSEALKNFKENKNVESNAMKTFSNSNASVMITLSRYNTNFIAPASEVQNKFFIIVFIFSN